MVYYNAFDLQQHKYNTNNVYTSSSSTVQKKQKKLAKVNGHTDGGAFDDPLHANDDEVARIARELERKYGNAYAGKNCGKNSAGAACYDKGTGYDESDSFIDNTDAYDESVPVEIETDRGGFYINSGSLVFKPLANFERPDDALRIPKARKRTLSTSSESDGEHSNGAAGGAGDRADAADGATAAASSAAASARNGPSDKRAKLLVDGKVVTTGKPAARAKEAGEPAADNGSKKLAAAGAIKTISVKDMLRAKRDSMRKELIDGGVIDSSADDDEASESAGGSDDSSDEEDDDGGGGGGGGDEDDDDNDDDDEDGDEEEEDGADDAGGTVDMETNGNADGAASTVANRPTHLRRPSAAGDPSDAAGRANGSDIRLPADLPAELLSNIVRLRDAGAKMAKAMAAAGAPAASGPGKCGSLFDAANTELLYRIDTAARAVGGTVRNTIYNYLEHYLPCTKQTLQMRAKKCRLQREEAKTHKIVRQLRAAVEATMPQVMAAYEVECKRISDLRADAVRADNREQLAALKAPKRRFVWTEATRALNAELFAQRRQSYHVIKPRKETLDEFVHKYVREFVVGVWPDGFMRMEELVREFERFQAAPGGGAASTVASGRKDKKEEKKRVVNADAAKQTTVIRSPVSVI